MLRGSFEITLVLWIAGVDESFDPAVNLQLVSGRARLVRELGRRPLTAGTHVRAVLLEATIDQALDPSGYPFDQHRLKVGFQTNLPTNQLILKSDDAGSGLSPDLFSPGWHVGRPVLATDEQDVGTTSAAIDDGPASRFSRLTVSVPVARESGILALGGFAGFAAAAAIALFSFAIPEGNFPARLSTLNGGVFAAIGNRYLVNDRFGVGSSSALSETVSAVAFVVVALALAAALGNERLRAVGRLSTAVRVERTMFVVATCLTAAAGISLLHAALVQ
jgi:hypothetical protein